MNKQFGNSDVTVDAPSYPAAAEIQTRKSADDGTLPTPQPRILGDDDPVTHKESLDDGPGSANGATAALPAPMHERDDPGGTAAFYPVQAHDKTDHARSGGSDTEPMDAKRAAGKKAPLPRVTGYDVLGVLGRGSMGIVYKAQQRGLKRTVALKMILAADHASERDLGRFRSEAEAVALLQHPHIVQIYEVGDQDGHPFFSLEYVDGESLAKKVAGTPLPPRHAAEILVVLAQAIQYAHDKGVIHRDLKPSNVLLTLSGLPKISDFGLAKRLDDDSGQTRDGSILGTPSYMPPEQAEGRAADVGPLSDVYSLGAILYELLTGRAPFRASNMLETLELVRKQEPVAPTQLQPGTPRDLETICLKCLQKDARQRYASAADLAGDLRRYLAGEPILARPTGPWERGWRWCRRNPTVAALTAAVAGLLVAALAGSIAFSAIIYDEKNATELALQQADDNYRTAEENRVKADDNYRTAEENRIKADANRVEAVKNRIEAERNAAIAKQKEKEANHNAHEAHLLHTQAVDHVVILTQKMHNKLRRKSANPQTEKELVPLRNDVLALMRQELGTLSRNMENADVTAYSTAFTHQKMGDLFRDLGMGSDALKHFELAHDHAKKAAEAFPDDDKGRANWGLMLARLGDMEIDLRGDVPRARALYRQALDLQEDVQAHPRSNYYQPVDNSRIQANYHFKLGQTSMLAGDPVAARKSFEKAIMLRRDWLDNDPKNPRAIGLLAHASLCLADACWRLDDQAAMRAAFKEGIDLVDQLIARDAFHDFKADLAESLLMYGDASWRLGAFDEAKNFYDRCPPLLTIAINKEPESIRYIGLISRMRYGQALCAARVNDTKTASERFADGLKWREKLLAIDGESLPQLAAHVPFLARAGKHTEAAARADSLRPRAAKDPDLLVQLAGCYALCAEAASDQEQKQQFTDKALELLREIIAGGYQDYVSLRTHPDLRALEGNPAFQVLVAKRK